MGSLEGRVALVTGASRGIGRAIALELARSGARVGIVYRSSDAEAKAVADEIASLHRAKALVGVSAVLATSSPGLESAANNSSDGRETSSGSNGADTGARTNGAELQGEYALLLKADIGKSSEARGAVEKVVQQWGRLDILVNNAGITRDKTLRKLSDDDWVDVINTNLNSVFFCTSAAVPVMIQQSYGRIVNISSLIAQVGNVGQANYGASKGGIIAFTKTASLELARFNITVNGISPGFTDTDMLANVAENIKDQIKAKIPMGRFARPEEIAKAVAFLSADGDYITGQQLNVNGGLYG